MMGYFLASMLALNPVVDEATQLRLVSVGTDGEEVVWYLDGDEVARTLDGEAARVPVPPGDHELHAVTEHTGEWQVMARAEPEREGRASYVPAWTAQHRPGPGPGSGAAVHSVPGWAFPVALAVGGAAFVLWPERRRTKGP